MRSFGQPASTAVVHHSWQRTLSTTTGSVLVVVVVLLVVVVGEVVGGLVLSRIETVRPTGLDVPAHNRSNSCLPWSL
jgi:hypothetical protein